MGDWRDWEPEMFDTESSGALGGPKARSPRAQDWEVPTGPEWTSYYEPQVGTIPLSGANLEVRNYSPFTLRILPPLIYLANPAWMLGNEQNQIDPVSGDVMPINLGIIGSSGVGNMLNFEEALAKAKGNEGADSDPLSSIVGSVASTPPPVVTGGYMTGKPTGGASGGAVTQIPKVTITDMQVAHDIAYQLERILKVPPLTLFINPTQFQIQYTKIQQYSERTRYGLLRQEWGEELPKLNITGRIGAYLASSMDSAAMPLNVLSGGIGIGAGTGDAGVSALNTTQGSYGGFQTQNLAAKGQAAEDSGTGVQFANKRNSASWQQLMALFTFYKNNGYIYDTLTTPASNAHHLVGCIAIDYDNWTYIGNMDSFDWSYTEEQQGGGVEFSIAFTAVQMYDKHDAEKTKAILPLKSPVPSMYDDRHDGLSRGSIEGAVGLSDRFGSAITAPEDEAAESPPVEEEKLGEVSPIPPKEDAKKGHDGFKDFWLTPPPEPDYGSVPMDPYFRNQ